MKYFNLLLFTIFISSCSSTKKVIQTTPKETTQQNLVTVEEIPEVIEDSISQTIEVVNNKGTVLAEVDTHEEAEETLKEAAGNSFKFDHSSFDILLQKHVTNKGNVDYKGFKKDSNLLQGYIASLAELTPENNWSKQEKLAFWINAYNAMTIDLILRHYPVNSIKDIKDPWKQRYWQLGEKWYNLDEIEHQIIRKMNEPRIHFALVCAAQSCPKLYNKAFNAATLEDDLSHLTREFLADATKNTISENSIKLSKIFKWFAKDFKKDGSLVDFLNQYSDITISSKAKKSFKSYNWDLND